MRSHELSHRRNPDGDGRRKVEGGLSRLISLPIMRSALQPNCASVGQSSGDGGNGGPQADWRGCPVGSLLTEIAPINFFLFGAARNTCA